MKKSNLALARCLACGWFGPVASWRKDCPVCGKRLARILGSKVKGRRFRRRHYPRG